MVWPEKVSPEEEKVIEELKKRIRGNLPPKLLEDESLFYRFCKARDFKLEESEAMLRKVCKYTPTSFVGFDKEGSLIRYFDMGNPDNKGMFNSIKKTEFLKYCFYMGEQDAERCKQHSLKIGKPVTQAVHICNFENLSFFQATHKKTLETTLVYMKMFQDNYPERMKRIYHINASIYHNVLMSVIKTVMATPLLQKIQCFGQDGWKEALLRDIDADVLPAFLGGNRTDPDGNPLCKTFITHGEKIPESYYLCNYEKTIFQAPGARTLTIARRSKEEVSFKVREPDSYLEGEFELKEWDKDIKFAVLFTEKSSEESKPVEIVEKKRVDTCFGPEKVSIHCRKIGTYILLFDNTYSWMHPKELAFRARVRSPGVDENRKWT
ncbi:unnamed protein product [Larinioides sclopetarius]|uniref:SEC14-like protein 2 n=1 Tax=Larinioides sclopetarius TaxID=280406 RepID=A0AAV2ASM4_9ARAC